MRLSVPPVLSGKNYSVALLLLVFISCSHLLSGQERRKVEALRASGHITIDALLDEPSWQTAPPATDFIIYNPRNGAPSSYRTEVRILYDDDALYVGAVMYDSAPDSIYTELGQRDAGDINADHFWIEISPFNDGLNGEMFKVSASNVQIDNKLTTTESWGYMDTWDAVWESRTRVTSEGWIAELKIPYSALRFPRAPEQLWGINFWREVRRNRETSSWNFVTKEFGAAIAHMGLLAGIRNVQPPLRLSLVPYVSGYLEQYSAERGLKSSWNGGMDVKLGLSESFTLDATLIPDFGQVESDDHVLNLTPYEVKYNEKRPFFMEGTELFNKGEVFYSRRIGGTPRLAGEVYGMTGEEDTIRYNPIEVSLLNATKISGRTGRGLGIGVFNAITNSMWAELENRVTGEKRRIMTEPLTNYNMLVLDQTLKNDSYISLMNTSVIRAAEKNEHFYTANVSGIESLVKTSDRLWSAAAGLFLSQKYYSRAETGLGHAISFDAGKTGGRFRTGYKLSVLSDTYDPNDMGYLRRNNEITHSVNFAYNTFEPSGNIMSTNSSVSFIYSQLFKPREFTSAGIMANSMIMLMNYWTFSTNIGVTPWGEDDYFEPRTPDMSIYYHRPPAIQAGFMTDTDRSKRLYMMINGGLSRAWSEYNQHGFMLSVMPQFKVNRRLSFEYMLSLDNSFNDIGYVPANPAEGITFGRRDLRTVTNMVSGAFIFSSSSYLTLRTRHYWSRAEYDGNYYTLQNDGSLFVRSYQTPVGNHDMNTNFLNIDMVYTWRFAPGSEMSLVWKNMIYSMGDVIIKNGIENMREMFTMPRTNSVSLKILYYLDYQNFRKLFQGN